MQREPHFTNAALMARRRAALPNGLGQGFEIFADRFTLEKNPIDRWISEA